MRFWSVVHRLLVNLFRFTKVNSLANSSKFICKQIYFSDVLFISFANLIIRFVQYSVFKVREAIDFVNNFRNIAPQYFKNCCKNPGNHFMVTSGFVSQNLGVSLCDISRAVAKQLAVGWCFISHHKPGSLSLSLITGKTSCLYK